MTPVRPANAPDLPARRDPPGQLSLVPAPLWHPRCGHSPTDAELNALREAEHAAYMAWHEVRLVANQRANAWRALQETLDRAYERVARDGDEVVPEDLVKP